MSKPHNVVALPIADAQRLAPEHAEAVRLAEAPFVVGVQWHPEFAVREHPFSLRLFEAFDEAYRTRAAARRGRVERAA